ncbi:hypothetical protein JXL21_02365 [Candidatus Bathyarchaeota archaeon]|nr:hypothetical protein [Candidatus Bathyarchaeota archaeon]
MAGYTVFESRRVLATLVIVCAVTGGNLWIHRGDMPLGYARHESRFGFSLVYPQTHMAAEFGLPGISAEPSELLGGFQAVYATNDDFQGLLVIWLTESGTPNLESELEGFYRTLNDVGWEIKTRQSSEGFERDGHLMIRQLVSITQGNDELLSLNGVWYEPWPSLKANRVYIFHVSCKASPDAATRLEEQYQWYLERFESHG